MRRLSLIWVELSQQNFKVRNNSHNQVHVQVTFTPYVPAHAGRTQGSCSRQLIAAAEEQRLYQKK